MDNSFLPNVTTSIIEALKRLCVQRCFECTLVRGDWLGGEKLSINNGLRTKVSWNKHKASTTIVMRCLENSLSSQVLVTAIYLRSEFVLSWKPSAMHFVKRETCVSICSPCCISSVGSRVLCFWLSIKIFYDCKLTGMNEQLFKSDVCENGCDWGLHWIGDQWNTAQCAWCSRSLQRGYYLNFLSMFWFVINFPSLKLNLQSGEISHSLAVYGQTCCSLVCKKPLMFFWQSDFSNESLKIETVLECQIY